VSETDQAQHQTQPGKNDAAPGKILIVEDDADTNALIETVLDMAGFKCVQTYSAEEALQYLEQEVPDAIITDIMLPGMSGNSLCEHLKMRRRTNLIPVIILTALRTQKDKFYGLRVGANDYLTKPFKADDLTRCIRRNIERRNKMKEEGINRSIQIDLQSDLKLLDSVNELLTVVLQDTEVDELEAQKVKYAVLEMGHNAIEWGNRNDASLVVSINCHMTKDRLVFRIQDQGSGFAPGNLEHAATPDSDPAAHLSLREKLGLREGGFGILLSRKYMDEVEYNEKGNCVTLVKHMVPRNPPEA